MATVNYTLRIDDNDKQRAEQVFRELGMTFATGINIYVKMVSRQQRIPFELDLGKRNNNTAPIDGNDSRKKKWDPFMALEGILAGYDIDLDKEREERILSR